MKIIYFNSFKTKYGQIHLATNGKAVVKISLGDGSRSEFFSWLEDNFPDYIYEENEKKTARYVVMIREFLMGKRQRLEMPIKLMASGFKYKALMALKKVPYGKTISYGELAARAGNPRACRAAGSACATNPLPFVIPCHRVIAAQGKLGGYGGGEKFKLVLLRNEGITGIVA